MSFFYKTNKVEKVSKFFCYFRNTCLLFGLISRFSQLIHKLCLRPYNNDVCKLSVTVSNKIAAKISEIIKHASMHIDRPNFVINCSYLLTNILNAE